MQLLDLEHIYPNIKGFPYSKHDFQQVTRSNQNLTTDSVFVAIKGSSWDGHQAIQEALDAGVVAVIAETSAIQSDHIFLTPDTRAFYGDLANHFYGKVSENLFSVGITGTNGKTSTAYYVEALLRSLDKSVGFIGTIDHHLGEQVWETKLTSPDVLDLHKRIHDFHSAGAQAFVMEVSSHALDQKRVQGVEWDVAIYTNLSQDHLDYHGSMESYYNAKKSLFCESLNRSIKKTKTAVINIDDSYGQKLAKEITENLLTYGKSEGAELQFSILEQSFQQTRFRLTYQSETKDFSLPILGEHNLYNLCAALLAVSNHSISPIEALSHLSFPLAVPGRLEKVIEAENQHVYIDYAHTPDALKNVLSFIDQIRFKGQQNIFCVFGCGGDRDKTKRPLMAQAVAAYADRLIVTSDNPRNEKPAAIIDDILKGLTNQDYDAIVDRKEAIHFALSEAQKGDVILIAGKGHETYQEVAGKRHYFSDRHIVKEYYHDSK